MLITCRFLVMLLVASIHKSQLSTTRLPCNYAANFDVVLSNMRETGTVGKTVISTTTRRCTLECVSWPNCKSLNFNSRTNVCQLLERLFNESVASLKEENGWVYMTTNDGNLNVSFLKKHAFMSQLLLKDRVLPKVLFSERIFYHDHLDQTISIYLIGRLIMERKGSRVKPDFTTKSYILIDSSQIIFVLYYRVSQKKVPTFEKS